MNEEARRKDKESISDSKALVTECDTNRGEVQTEVEVGRKTHVLLLWKARALPEKLSTLLKGERGSRRC